MEAIPVSRRRPTVPKSMLFPPNFAISCPSLLIFLMVISPPTFSLFLSPSCICTETLTQICFVFLGSAKPSKSTEEKTKRGGGDAEKKLPPEDAITSEAIVDEGEDENLLTTQHSDDSDETVRNSNDEKRKKKRKRKRMQVIDLRFDTSMEKTKSSEKRRERKKKYLEAKKKKRQKSKTEEDLDFPGHEQIKFGDVVQAPPKLVAVPKVLKNVPEASRERIRLQAIEEYRKRKGWTSRPGLKLPIVTETHPM
uniref:Uncharacterized protein n=1 Tax=Manihot esculenta TaxID=3983 RepID=A0A2C9VT77_MANES